MPDPYEELHQPARISVNHQIALERVQADLDALQVNTRLCDQHIPAKGVE